MDAGQALAVSELNQIGLVVRQEAGQGADPEPTGGGLGENRRIVRAQHDTSASHGGRQPFEVGPAVGPLLEVQ